MIQHLTLVISINSSRCALLLPVLSLNLIYLFYMKVPFQCFLCTCEHVLSITDETPTSRPGSRSAVMLPGARPASALASVMSVLMGNPERLPFSVEPNIGAIEPGAMQNFSIRFSPLEVGQFQGRLFCRYNKSEYSMTELLNLSYIQDFKGL